MQPSADRDHLLHRAADRSQSEFREALTNLANASVPVHVCRSIAEDMDKVAEFGRLGFTLEYPRDAFALFATEGSAVISF